MHSFPRKAHIHADVLLLKADNRSYDKKKNKKTSSVKSFVNNPLARTGLSPFEGHVLRHSKFQNCLVNSRAKWEWHSWDLIHWVTFTLSTSSISQRGFLWSVKPPPSNTDSTSCQTGKKLLFKYWLSQSLPRPPSQPWTTFVAATLYRSWTLPLAKQHL